MASTDASGHRREHLEGATLGGEGVEEGEAAVD